MGTNEELLAKNGFYANLIKTQLGDDQNNARIQKEKTKKLQSMKKLSTNFSKVIENMQKFEKDKLGKEKEEEVEIKKKEIMDLIKDKKLDLILGTIGGFIYGGGTPLTGLLLGNVINALSPQIDLEKMKNESLKWTL